MNDKFNFILAALCVFPVTQLNASHNTYWECSAQDNYYQEWKVQNEQQQVAINQALSVCTQQSREPQSCKVAKENCESFINGHSTRPRWRCVAMDDLAKKWASNEYRFRDDAALAALDYCKQQSACAQSCYINLLTCKNLNK